MPGTLAARITTKMDFVDDVLIDVGGRFKYILCKVYEPLTTSESSHNASFKYIVRGTSLAEFHSGIYDVLDAQLETLGLSSECVGGGKIEHNPAEKTLIIFGASQGYGRADHSITVDLLRKKYPDYNNIIWRDE